MSGNTSIVSSTPGFVVGTYGAKAVRNAALAMYAGRPGLVSYGDFAVTQRAAGANMSVDIAAGAAIVYPAQVTRQGPYYVQYDSTFNTSSDGGYTWTAADATNPRIDLVCLEVKDNAEDASGSTGLRFRIVDGTPSASATHQLATTYWPAVPTGCVPIAAVKIPATDTTISTTDITNLNPIAGPNQAYGYVSATETTTSASVTRLTTPDFVTVYVPHAHARVRVGYEGLIKGSSATPTIGTALFCNNTQLQISSNAAIANVSGGVILSSGGAFYQRFYSTATSGISGYSTPSADSTNVTTGLVGTTTAAPLEIIRLAAGWYVIEARYSISTGTLSAKERHIWAEVVA